MMARWLTIPALLALSVLGAAPRRAPLPPLPTTVYSRWGPVPVLRVRVVDCPDSSGATPAGVIGCYTGRERRIQIADTLSLRWQHFVLEHEKVHVAFRDVNARFDDPKDEERVAWVVARYRLGELEGRP